MSTEQNTEEVNNNLFSGSDQTRVATKKDIDNLSNKIDNLTILIAKSLEEKRYATIRERERRW
jgi:hypothetical protein